MNGQCGAFHGTASSVHRAATVDLQNIAGSHLAPVNAPAIDEEAPIAERVTEVVINSLMQIKACREPECRS
jgi:hypothetical protein